MPIRDGWVSVAEAARQLGLSRPTVLARVATKQLEAEIIADRPVITRASLDALLERQNAGAAA